MNNSEGQVSAEKGPKLVSIGVPIYKRLEYLSSVLKMVEAQDYPAVELVISDNGENGTKVRDIVAAEYRRPYRFRQNPSTVDVVQHHNQIIRAATGEYYFLLSDDDEITPNLVSELVGQLERNPDATLAYAKLEVIDEAGKVLRSSRDDVPPKLSGPEFIRAVWQTYEFGFDNVEGFLTRTKLWRDIGGYSDFRKGNHVDNAAVIAMCLQHHVVFTSKCTYRHRVYPHSHGRNVSMKDLAGASSDFLRWLDRDPALREFSAQNSKEWKELKDVLKRMTWETYFWRWQNLYRDRLPPVRWAREAFRMPFIPAYYQRVGSVLRATSTARIKKLLGYKAEASPEVLPPGQSPSDTCAKS